MGRTYYIAYLKLQIPYDIGYPGPKKSSSECDRTTEYDVP